MLEPPIGYIINHARMLRGKNTARMSAAGSFSILFLFIYSFPARFPVSIGVSFRAQSIQMTGGPFASVHVSPFTAA